jgi:hypothetical protein
MKQTHYKIDIFSISKSNAVFLRHAGAMGERR